MEHFVGSPCVAVEAARDRRSVYGDGGENVVQVRRSVAICGARRADGSARGFVSWIFAVAEEDGASRMGELSQAAFLVKAQSLGFGLALPWGDSEKYDFVVWARPGGRLLRVQVKATGRLYRRGYEVQPVYSTRKEGKKRYTAEDIDVLAAHVQGLDVWYLLPIGAYGRAKSLRFYPDIECRCPRWEEYREKWGVLEQRRRKGR